MRASVERVTVFTAAAICFLLLRSHDLIAVDGAIRAFNIYREARLQFHSNSHMLYPVFVLAWTRLAAAVGIGISDPKEFIRVVQVMNAAFAAACCAMLFSLVRSLTASMKLALAAALAWSLSHAVLLHATNAAEPMPGLFFSVCALAVAVMSARRSVPALMIASGFLLAAAMASYQSMVFLGVACGLIALLWPVNNRSASLAVALQRTVLLVLGFVASLVLLFGFSYWLQGARTSGQAKRLFFGIGGTSVYGGFTLSKLVNLLVGLAHAAVITVPSGYTGLRSLLRTQPAWFVWTTISVALICCTLMWLFARERRDTAPGWLHVFTLACVASLYLGLILLLYWVPLYDKLWLQPLWLLVLLVFVNVAYVVPPSTRVKAALAALGIVFAGISLAAATSAARGPWLNFDEGIRVRNVVSAGDLVITDWSSVALLYRQVWAGDAGSLDFPATACDERSNGVKEMEGRISNTRARAGQVYFLGVLDLKEPDWDPFLGARCGVPFETLRVYREHSQIIAAFQSDGRTITLRRFDSQPLAVASR